MQEVEKEVNRREGSSVCLRTKIHLLQCSTYNYILPELALYEGCVQYMKNKTAPKRSDF